MSERKVKLQIKDMTKRYDNGDGVEHINLEIYEGEIVTFLGPSGCGKTTILRTIGGFLDVTSGDILVDGVNVREYDIHTLRDRLGYVAQKAVLFSGTVASNVTLGQENASPEQVARVIDRSQSA